MTRTKKPARKRKTAKPQPKPRTIEHRSLGACTVLGIFLTDAGGIVADVDVAGVRRTLSLDQSFWLSDISSLALEALKRKPTKAEPEAAEPEAEAEPEAVVELALNKDGHLDDGDAESEEEIEEESDAELIGESA